MPRRFQFRLRQVSAATALVCAAAWVIREIASTGPNYGPSQFSLVAGTWVFCAAAIYLVGFRVFVLVYAGIMGVAFLGAFLIGIWAILELYL
ncbi:MAG TPA: hypothetical protein VNH11_00225 [Pirellulales bacterium]|nr:hypothetical protein [Pirellulales bacterium]